MKTVDRIRRRWGALHRVAAAAVGVLAVTAGAGVWSATAATTTTAAPPMVRVAQGTLQGQLKDGLDEYFGIPYAAPPVGQLRWKPPQPAKPWTGVRQAVKFGNSCPQLLASSTEDCLYLNVYQPTTPASGPRPVMVWVHGGAYMVGSGGQYDPSLYAAQHGAVVVSFNYRLGPLGFLALPSLAAESPDHASGQYGLMDQQAALRWVQQNIAAFGGDPHNVTVFGESAGASSICEQIASPTAAGLFQHAIAESGCSFPSPSQQQADTTGTAFADRLGCTDVATAAACLRGKSAAELINNADEGSLFSITTVDWFPAWGGSLLPDNVLNAFDHGHVNDVTVINGTNNDEGALFVAMASLSKPVSAQTYPTRLAEHFGPAAVAQIEAHYPLSAYSRPAVALAAAETDAGMVCPSYAANQRLAARGITVYAYEFADPKPVLAIPGFPGTGHAGELPYVLHTIGGWNFATQFTPAQAALSDRIIGYWSAMAATGDPNTPGAPAWPAFTTAQPTYLELTPSAITPNNAIAQQHQCAFWLPLEANGTVSPLM